MEPNFYIRSTSNIDAMNLSDRALLELVDRASNKGALLEAIIRKYDLGITTTEIIGKIIAENNQRCIERLEKLTGSIVLINVTAFGNPTVIWDFQITVDTIHSGWISLNSCEIRISLVRSTGVSYTIALVSSRIDEFTDLLVMLSSRPELTPEEFHSEFKKWYYG